MERSKEISSYEDGVIVISPPVVAGAKSDEADRLHSAFNLLGVSKRASLAGRLGIEDAAHFSAPVEAGGVWDRERGFASLYLKAPGTDIYLPRELEQFAPAISQIIHYNYTSGQTGAANRDGSEWAHLIVTQRMEQVLTAEDRSFDIHLDMRPNDVIERGAWFNDERYVISDTPRMGTIFYDTDTGLVPDDLIPQSDAFWENKLKEIFESKSSSARKFQPYDIAHFNSTTPHSRECPDDVVCRTFLTLGFGHGYAPDSLEQIKNPFLLRAMERQQELSSFALRSSYTR